MKLIKTTWADFKKEAAAGVAYLGSTFNKDVQEITDQIDKKDLQNHDFFVDRTYVGGTSVLRFKKDDGGETRLDKRGAVYLYGKFFIIIDGSSVVVYSKIK